MGSMYASGAPTASQIEKLFAELRTLQETQEASTLLATYTSSARYRGSGPQRLYGDQAGYSQPQETQTVIKLPTLSEGQL